MINIKKNLSQLDDDQREAVKSLVLDYSTAVGDAAVRICDIVRSSIAAAIVKGWPVRESIGAAISSMRFVYDKFVRQKSDGEKKALTGLDYIAYQLDTVGKEDHQPIYFD